MVGRFRKNDDDKRPDPPKRSPSRPPKDDDKDKGRRLPFGGRDKPDERDTGSGRRFPLPGGRDADERGTPGRGSPFGGRGGDKPDDSSGRRSPFGGRGDDKPDDSGGRRSPFGGRGDDRDKPAQPKGLTGRSPSSGQRGDKDKDKGDKDKGSGLGRFMPGRKDKDEDKAEPRRSPFVRGADEPAPGSRPTSRTSPGGGGPFGERRSTPPGSPGDRGTPSRPSPFGGSRIGQDEDRPEPGARPGGVGGDRPGSFSRSSPGDRSEPGGASRPGGLGGDRPGSSFSRSSPGDRDRAEPGTRPGGLSDRPGGFSRPSPGDRDEPGGASRPGGIGGDRPGSSFSRSSTGDRSEPGGAFGNRGLPRTPIGADDDDDDDAGPPARPAGFGSRGLGDRPDTGTPPRTGSRPGAFGTPPRSGSQAQPGGIGTRPPSGDRPGSFSRPGAPRPEEKKEEGRKSRIPSLIPGRGSKPAAEPEKPAVPSRSSGFGREAPGKSPIPSRSASAGVGTVPGRPLSSPAKPLPKAQPDKKAKPGKKGADKTPAPTRAHAQAAPLPQKKNAPQFVGGGLDLDRKLDIIGVALVMFGGIMFFGVIPSMSFGLLPPVEGGLTGTINDALSTLFGWGKIVWPMLFFAIGLWLMLRYFGGQMFDVPYFRVVGGLVLYACVLTWMHMLQLVDDTAATVEAFRPISESLARDQGEGGGYLGHQFYFLLLSQLGDWGTLVSLIGWLVVGLMLTFDVSVVELGQFIGSIFAMAGLGLGDRAAKRAAKEAAAAESVPVVRPGETPPASTAQQMPLAPSTLATVEAPAVLSTTLEKPAVGTAAPGRPTPLIRRRGQGNGDTEDESTELAPAARPAAALLPVVEKTEEETRQPARRRLPHLGRSGGSEPEGADQTPDDKNPEAIPAKEELSRSSGRLGFLRRKSGNGDESEKPAAEAPANEAPAAPPPSPENAPSMPPVLPVALARAEEPAEHPEPVSPGESPRIDQPPGPRRVSDVPERSTPGQPGPAREMPTRPSGEMPSRPSPFARPMPGSRRPMGEEMPPNRDSAAEKPAEAPPDSPIERPMMPPVRDRAQALGLPQRPGMQTSRPIPPRSPFGDRTGEDKPADRIADKIEEKPAQTGDKIENLAESKPADPVESLLAANAAPIKEPDSTESKPAEVDPPARPAFKFGLPRFGSKPEPEKPPVEETTPKADATPAVESKPATAEDVTPPAEEPVHEKPAIPRGLLPRVEPAKPAIPALPSRPAVPEKRADLDDDDFDDLDDDNIDDEIDDEIDDNRDDDDDLDEDDALDDTIDQDDAPPIKTSPPTPAVLAGSAGVPPRTIPPMRPAPPPPQAGQITTPPPARRDEPARPPVRPPTNVPLGRPAQQGPTAAVARGANAPQAKATPPKSGGYELPDFRKILRQGGEQHINDEILLDKARIIEDTLASFGAPGKVVEVNPGPVITQFGIEPDYLLGRGGKKMRVKVGSIARLDADLALALAARSIRIEAPVPGKGFVGIEVPNAETTLVGLYDIMDSPQFNRMESKLRLALGLSVDGTPVAADLSVMPHLLIAGTTGSGKSVCVNSIIACLLLSNTPDDVQFIMVDPKRVELTGYNGIPHLVAPVVVELERIVGVLQWVQREMEERYRKFAAIGARNIQDYNGRLGPGERKMPYYVVVVDELADLMMLAPDETERLLARLAQMARATGIHLIISTQRPSVDIITGLIKANFPARIAFAVASSVDSRVILDQPGAEKLLGRGDMLFQSPDAAAPLRMQGVFVSDEEISRITRYWKGLVVEEPGDDGRAPAAPGRSITFNAAPVTPAGNRPAAAPKSPNDPAQRAFWDDSGSVTVSTGDDGEVTGEDELYDEAVDLVMRLNKASISLLQRRLRIGYTRAARLIDIMEQDGIVGPAESGSKPREVLKTTRD